MRIYTAVFRPWTSDYTWFGRDSGLVTEGLKSVGVDSRLVILATHGIPEDYRFLPASHDQFLSPSFWKSLALDAVVLQGGGEAGVEPVVQAIRASGTYVLFRMDSDGIIDPRVDPFLYTYAQWWWRVFHREPFAHARALATTSAKLLWPRRWGAGRLAERLSKADAIMVETLPAQSRLQRLMHYTGRPDLALRIRQVPIPVPGNRTYNPSIAKDRLLISVARWDDAQKDGPKLVKVLAEVLRQWPDYEAIVVGNGQDLLHTEIQTRAKDVSDRLRLTGRLDHERVPTFLQKARIFLSTSRGEGFPNSVAESLCCGCSVVGPAAIAAMHYFTAHSSGSLAWTRRTADLVDAVNADINAWEAGLRDPIAISAHFSKQLAPEVVAKQIVNLVISR
ncbi:MAG: glycosyltransferase family 4 protein [Terrimicrobiaceae bacterium]